MKELSAFDILLHCLLSYFSLFFNCMARINTKFRAYRRPFRECTPILIEFPIAGDIWRTPHRVYGVVPHLVRDCVSCLKYTNFRNLELHIK